MHFRRLVFVVCFAALLLFFFDNCHDVHAVFDVFVFESGARTGRMFAESSIVFLRKIAMKWQRL